VWFDSGWRNQRSPLRRGFSTPAARNNRPWRVRTRPPSMYNLQVLKKLAIGELIADMVVMIGSLDPVFGEVDR